MIVTDFEREREGRREFQAVDNTGHVILNGALLGCCEARGIVQGYHRGREDYGEKIVENINHCRPSLKNEPG